MMQSRLANFVARRPEWEVDAILFSVSEYRRYLYGWDGARIEDSVILGETGATPLSKASR